MLIEYDDEKSNDGENTELDFIASKWHADVSSQFGERSMKTICARLEEIDLKNKKNHQIAAKCL